MWRLLIYLWMMPSLRYKLVCVCVLDLFVSFGGYFQCFLIVEFFNVTIALLLIIFYNNTISSFKISRLTINDHAKFY